VSHGTPPVSTRLQSLNGKPAIALADLIVHKITEAMNAITFK
jgi:hypothetical protein